MDLALELGLAPESGLVSAPESGLVSAPELVSGLAVGLASMLRRVCQERVPLRSC